MTINRLPTTCIVVHLADSEVHFPDAQQAEAWAEKLEAGIRIHAIEEAQQPCWMAYCDEPTCEHPEGDENDTPTHLVGETQADAERGLTDLQRTAAGTLLCTVCREDAAPARPAPTDEAWIDKQGDVWRLGEDGLMHAYETAPFPREYVEKKWGPLRSLGQTATTHS